MFNIGGMELVVIGVVALIVLGPDRLPGALRQVGGALGELRRMSQGFRAELTSALTVPGPDAGPSAVVRPERPGSGASTDHDGD